MVGLGDWKLKNTDFYGKSKPRIDVYKIIYKRFERFFQRIVILHLFWYRTCRCCERIRLYIYFLFSSQFRSNRKSVKPNSRRTSVQLKIDDLSGNFPFALYFCLDVLMSCLAVMSRSLLLFSLILSDCLNKMNRWTSVQ